MEKRFRQRPKFSCQWRNFQTGKNRLKSIVAAEGLKLQELMRTLPEFRILCVLIVTSQSNWCDNSWNWLTPRFITTTGDTHVMTFWSIWKWTSFSGTCYYRWRILGLSLRFRNQAPKTGCLPRSKKEWVTRKLKPCKCAFSMIRKSLQRVYASRPNSEPTILPRSCWKTSRKCNEFESKHQDQLDAPSQQCTLWRCSDFFVFTTLISHLKVRYFRTLDDNQTSLSKILKVIQLFEIQTK